LECSANAFVNLLRNCAHGDEKIVAQNHRVNIRQISILRRKLSVPPKVMYQHGNGFIERLTEEPANCLAS